MWIFGSPISLKNTKKTTRKMTGVLVIYVLIVIGNSVFANNPACLSMKNEDVSTVYQSNYGSHFILGFTQQYSGSLYHGYNEITVIARFNAEVSLIMKDLLNTTSIKAGEVFNFTVPATFRMEGTGIEKKGIEIKSTTKIAVIGANYAFRTSDAFLALPTTTLGKTYVVATRLNSGSSSYQMNIGIISPRDGTKVTITLKTKGYFNYLNSTYTSGQSFTITLAKLETFHLIHNNDLSGTIVTSSYPVAVVSGSPCEAVGTSYCDHLVSFLLPVKKWGKQYILVPAIESKSTGDFYRVFASQETVVKSRDLTKNLDRGEFLEINLTKNALSSFVSCNKPCQVVQYLKGAVLNRKPDPSSIILPSIEQFATSYKAIPILKRQQFSNYIIIIIEATSKDALKFNKTSDVKLNWQKVKDTQYAWAIHNISAPVDIESCNHNKKFGVIVAGYKLYDSRQSYGYPAGFKFSDIDECKNPSLHSCPIANGYRCANTIGSYECVCDGLKTNDGKCTTEGFTSHRLHLRLNEKYTNALAVNTSEEYVTMESRIKKAIKELYKDNSNYQRMEVRQLMNGSVIADMELTFTDTYTSGISVLVDAVRNNSFGDFDVDPDAVIVVITGSCETYDKCPGNSTCRQMSENILSCPCNESYYFNGVGCLEFIEIKVELTLENEFTEELNNNSSPLYIELKRNITAELNEAFKDTPNFEEVIVLGFRNGSIIVDFIVKYLQDPVLNKKVVVADELKKKIIETGKLGQYSLKSVKIKGTPPPPTNLTHTGVTETRIDISWDKPTGYELFVINGYQASYKKLSEKEYKTQKMEPNVNTFVITGLDSGTFYQITVHGYNDEGIGDKNRIQVKTDKKSSSSQIVIIIVAVIVAVLLIIICMIIFIVLNKRRRDRSRDRKARQEGLNMGHYGQSKPAHYDNFGQHNQESHARL